MTGRVILWIVVLLLMLVPISLEGTKIVRTLLSSGPNTTRIQESIRAAGEFGEEFSLTDQGPNTIRPEVFAAYVNPSLMFPDEKLATLKDDKTLILAGKRDESARTSIGWFTAEMFQTPEPSVGSRVLITPGLEKLLTDRESAQNLETQIETILTRAQAKLDDREELQTLLSTYESIPAHDLNVVGRVQAHLRNVKDPFEGNVVVLVIDTESLRDLDRPDQGISDAINTINQQSNAELIGNTVFVVQPQATSAQLTLWPPGGVTDLRGNPFPDENFEEAFKTSFQVVGDLQRKSGASQPIRTILIWTSTVYNDNDIAQEIPDPPAGPMTLCWIGQYRYEVPDPERSRLYRRLQQANSERFINRFFVAQDEFAEFPLFVIDQVRSN